MKKLKNKFLPILICLIFSVSISACSSNKETSSNSTSSSSTKTEDSSSKTSSENGSDNKNTKDSGKAAFEIYNKVKMGMTKAEVDSTVKLNPKDEKVEGMKVFDYVDENTGFGVTVLYDDKDKAFGKTAIFKSYKSVASLISKDVKEDFKDKITKGMDYKDVVILLGVEGLEYSQSAMNAEYDNMGCTRIWPNKDGTCMYVFFSSKDKVMQVQFDDSSPKTN